MPFSAQGCGNLPQEAGDLLSDLLVQLRISWEQGVAQQHQKESHISCLKDRREISGVLTWCVSEVICREMIFPKNSIVSPQYYNSGFRCPTCLMETSFLSLALLMETWMLSDVGGPVHLPRHLGPVISSRVQVHVSRWICRISPGYVPVFIQKSSVSQVYIWLL